jgi:hypothetical protein
MKNLAEAVPVPGYLRDVVGYLREEEKELWDWFSSEKVREEFADAVRLDLLKSTYRLEREGHAELHAAADRARTALGLEVPLTLYQSQVGSGMNASLAYLPGEAHLILTGPVAATLSADELVAVISHELSHYVLWQLEGGAFLVADQILSALNNHPNCEVSHAESARLFRLYVELFADRGSLFVTGDAKTAIAGLVKISTGLSVVSAESYLRQAEEILKKDRRATKEQTHPETFLRARALQLWSEQGDPSLQELHRLIEGPMELGKLDLMAQGRLAGLTRRMLAGLLAPTWFRSTPVLAHARLFFEDFVAGEESGDAFVDALKSEDKPLRDYLTYVLLDFASADPDLEEAPLAAAFSMAGRLEIADRLEELAIKELGLPKRQVAKVRRECARILEEAAKTP